MSQFLGLVGAGVFFFLILAGVALFVWAIDR